jgi:lipopolysaccharide/colanic/teichoic acid biosynthesis glycosyltransferase
MLALKSINSSHRGCAMLHTSKYRLERRIIRRPISFIQSFNKRTFDIVVAIAGLVILSPLFLLISLGISVESPGPIMCRYKRYNSNNMEFEIFEFRTTLVDEREKTPNRRYDAIQCVTGFGQILCRSGLKKLPLLINVLRGEMSIVGSHLFTDAPGKGFSLPDLHEVRPGLVSWAHASDDRGENVDATMNVYRCIKCDRYYLENRSFVFDLKLLLYALLSKKTYS